MKNNEKYAHRISKGSFQLLDASGRPAANVKGRAKLVNHEFLFGSGAFDFVPLCSEGKDNAIAFYQENKAKDRDFYQERADKWTALFNYGTLPFYWGGYETVEGEPKFESRMRAAEYLVSHGAKVKGHPLCWHTECADWLMAYDEKTILEKQLDRIYRDVTAFKGVIDMWDVINETVIMPVYDRYDNAITRICKKYGRNTLIREVFEAANAANPDAVLLINDFNLSEDYRRVIDECLELGVPIKTIGIQSHQHQGYKGMAWMEEVLERFSCFGLPLHFTENTLVSGEIMPAHIIDLNDYQVESWPSTPEGEARQEQEWKEMYTRLFAHPLVGAITGWDFADGAWLNAPSGLLRADNTEKPSYKTLKKLISEEWTTDTAFVTDENGMALIEGFRGEYEISVSGQTGSFVLSKDQKADNRVILKAALNR